MAKFADGFVIAIPKKNLGAYRKIAALACKVWKEHGALEYYECAGADLAVKCGTPYPRLLKLKRGETVLFSWIVYKSRAHRDRVNAAVMKDPRITGMMDVNKMPFDVKKMSYGGFEVMVEG